MYGQLVWRNIKRSLTVLDRTFPYSPQQPGSPLATPLYHRLPPQEVEKISLPGKTRPCSYPHDPRTPLHSQYAPVIDIFSLFCSSLKTWQFGDAESQSPRWARYWWKNLELEDRWQGDWQEVLILRLCGTAKKSVTDAYCNPVGNSWGKGCCTPNSVSTFKPCKEVPF